jgi:hypothetical protein
MSNFWKPTDEQRHAILMIEVLGLLHDIGKLSDGFLHWQAEGPSSGTKDPYHKKYYYELRADPRIVFPSVSSKEIQKLKTDANCSSYGKPFEDRKDLTDLLRSQKLQWNAVEYTLAELILLAAQKYRNSEKEWNTIGKTFYPALLVGCMHGVAHYEKENPRANKQSYGKVYFRSSPFGKESCIETESPHGLTSALRELPLDQIGSSNRQNWHATIKKLMQRGIADNQRPTNEVTLWDWGFTVATLAKAAMTKIYQTRKPPELTSTPLDIAWRTLRINLDMLRLYTHSDRMSDLLGMRTSLHESFRKAQILLEETYAFANCLYHDETGAYYLFPDIAPEIDANLRLEIQQCFPNDLQPQVYLEEVVSAGELDSRDPTIKRQATRSLIAEPRKKALQALKRPVHSNNNFYPWEETWSERRPENAEICTVCGKRPVGYPSMHAEMEQEPELQKWATQKKAEERKICRICLSRRGRRSREWAESVETPSHNTIWIDEVADETERLALVVGSLGMEGWLDGTLLETIPVTREVSKNPSPARLYRIAETAREFWKHNSSHITRSTIGQHPYRLALYPEKKCLAVLKKDQSAVGSFHAYELIVDGLALSVVWDEPNDRFVTADNLAAFILRWNKPGKELESYLLERSFFLAEPSAYSQKRRSLTSIQFNRLERLPPYYPTIPIIAEPNICMLLVPAKKALALAKAVKQYYVEEMARVHDRLPIHLGIIFASRRTTVQTMLDAGRKMLTMPGQWEPWKVYPSPSSQRHIRFEQGSRSFFWEYPAYMGDGSTTDIWYSHLLTTDPSTDEINVVPVDQLQSGQTVYIRPSRFDFEFLDTTDRRFDIAYDQHGRRPARSTRSYLLDDLDRLDVIWRVMKLLKPAQRHQVIQTIEATRELWYGNDRGGLSQQDEIFRQFVSDTLAGASWPEGRQWKQLSQKEQQLLMQAGVRGELADLLELHHAILKEEEEQSANEHV